jgi:N-acetylglucosaminylphosphatidylinositol deacetylase
MPPAHAPIDEQIITFDDYGVSGHPNHRAIGRALAQLDDEKLPVFQLKSVPLWRKYVGPLDFAYTVISRIRQFGKIVNDDNLILISKQPRHARRAMQCHASQYVWYRKLSVWFSRYVYVNELQRVRPNNVMNTNANVSMHRKSD